MKVLGTFRIGTLEKYLKMEKGKFKVLFYKGVLEMYLKMEKEKF